MGMKQIGMKHKSDMGIEGAIQRKSPLSESLFPFEVIHYDEPAHNMPMFHWHEFMEICFVMQGCGHYQIEGRSFPVSKGDIVIINGIEKHRVTYQPEAPLFETVLHFDAAILRSQGCLPSDNEFLGLFGKGYGFLNRPLLDEETRSMLFELARNMLEEYLEKKPFFEMVIKAQLISLAAHLLRAGGLSRMDERARLSQKKQIDQLNLILNHIQDQFTGDLRMEQVARLFHMNPSYFSTYISKNLGISFTEYVTRLRIHEAVRLLKDGGRNSTEIAYASGFSSTSSFYAAFRRITGTTPGSYVI